MEMNLNKEELDIAKEVVNVGLGKAADSMAFFTKEKVLIRSLNFDVKSTNSIEHLSQKKTDELLYVLKTEIKGELGGICFLVFSEKEVNELVKIALPKSILDDKDKLAVMTDAILLEMDNIIVASVVTQFSNLFNFEMYGDVPSLTKTVLNGFTQIVESTNKTSKYVLYFKSEFNTSGIDINPEFIWLLDEKYIEGVKVLSQDKGIIEKMRS
tara:strand:- start:875 stop:1510 length:636 start_codon:yes stop_codon:yes gene_type:complete